MTKDEVLEQIEDIEGLIYGAEMDIIQWERDIKELQSHYEDE